MLHYLQLADLDNSLHYTSMYPTQRFEPYISMTFRVGPLNIQVSTIPSPFSGGVQWISVISADELPGDGSCAVIPGPVFDIHNRAEASVLIYSERLSP
jgi:hypothetical protein